MLKITIKTGNAAFVDEYDESMSDYYKSHECIRILEGVIKKLDVGHTSGSCIDINGNKVGEWSLD